MGFLCAFCAMCMRRIRPGELPKISQSIAHESLHSRRLLSQWSGGESQCERKRQIMQIAQTSDEKKKQKAHLKRMN